MENKVVNLKINTNLENTNKEFSNLKKGLDDSKKSAVDLNNTVNETGKKGNVFSNLTSGLSGLIPGFKGAEAAGQGVLKTMWAIVANPIGAIIAGIVLALTALYKAFASTKEGGEKIEQLMAGLGSVIDVLRDRVLKIGSAIAKFLTGDFKGALNEAKKAASGMGAEIEKEFKQASNAKKYLQQVDDALRSLGVSRAKLNRDLAKSKEIITDENASYAQKKKAIEEVRIAEEKQTQAELRNAEKKLKSIKQLNSLSDTSKEDLEKEAQAEAELYALQEKSATDRRAIRKTEIRADKEEQERVKTIIEERKKKSKEAYDADKAALEERLKQEGLNFQQRRDLIKKDLILNAADRKKLNDTINKEEQKYIEEHKKVVNELEKKYKDELLNSEAKTAEEKLDLQAQRDLAEINKIATTNEEKVRLLDLYNQKYNKLYQELDDKNKADQLAKESKHNLDLANSTQLSFQERLQAITDREALEKEMVFASQEAKTAFEKENSEARKKIAQEETKAKSAALDSYGSALGSIAGMLGESTDAGKAAAIASTTISTYSAATKAYESQLAIPTPDAPVRATIAAGIAVASGLLNVQKILSVKTPGGGSGGGSAPVAGGAPAAPSFNVVGNAGVNQLAQVMSNKGMPPVQAYVVASNVTSAQSLNRNIVSNATLG